MSRKEILLFMEDLGKFLGPEYIKFKRTGCTEEVYIEGWAAIEIANRIFGHNGWSSEIKSINIDHIENVEDRVTASVSVHMRITLEDGSFREDIGFGLAERIKGMGRAIKTAKKSAVTDSLKRTLRQFGNALGNCCYNEYYNKSIKYLKRRPTEPIPDNMLLRPIYKAPVKRKAVETVSKRPPIEIENIEDLPPSDL